MDITAASGHGHEQDFAERVGRAGGRCIAASVQWFMRRWKLILLSYASVLVVCSVLIGVIPIDEVEEPSSTTASSSSLFPRTWGGYNQRPTTEKCYQQERTAMLLSLFLGVLGVDQWYAHHWLLAVFKLVTGGGLGLWALVDTILWIVGGVYGTPGCPGGSSSSKSWAY